MGCANLRYFLIERGELLVKADARRNERHAVYLAWGEFAEARGFDQYYEGWGRIAAFGSTISKMEPPVGWRRSSKTKGFVPDRRTAKGKAELEAMQALPRVPFNHPVIHDHTNLNDWIGWTEKYHDEETGVTSFVGRVNHAWCSGQHHVLTIPAEQHGKTFPVPNGCREITRAEWDLIVAQEKVDMERREKLESVEQ